MLLVTLLFSQFWNTFALDIIKIEKDTYEFELWDWYNPIWFFDGWKIFMVANNSNTVKVYKLSSWYNLSTAVLFDSTTYSTRDVPRFLNWKPAAFSLNGDYLFISEGRGTQYKLTTPYKISTAQNPETVFDFPDIRHAIYSDDYKYFYVYYSSSNHANSINIFKTNNGKFSQFSSEKIVWAYIQWEIPYNNFSNFSVFWEGKYVLNHEIRWNTIYLLNDSYILSDNIPLKTFYIDEAIFYTSINNKVLFTHSWNKIIKYNLVLDEQWDGNYSDDIFYDFKSWNRSFKISKTDKVFWYLNLIYTKNLASNNTSSKNYWYSHMDINGDGLIDMIYIDEFNKKSIAWNQREGKKYAILINQGDESYVTKYKCVDYMWFYYGDCAVK